MSDIKRWRLQEFVEHIHGHGNKCFSMSINNKYFF
jgi:hypothetical protein